MKELVDNLKSRKLWLAVAAFITFIVNKQYVEAVAVVLGYFGVNVIEKK